MTLENATDMFAQYAAGPLDTDDARRAVSAELAGKMHALFVGRSDAYSTQRAPQKDSDHKAYFPVCTAKFGDGCQIGKKRAPCDECEARRLAPLTAEAMFKHVLGTQVIGLYLIDQGRVRCTVVDFDDHLDGSAECVDPREAPLIRGARLVEAARGLDLQMFLERSGGGRGAHAWLFFRDWVTASHARKLMEILLRRADLPLTVEVFPRQRDARTFGNLIALPYQSGPDNWRCGRSVFVDPESATILDPLKVMAEIEESLVAEIDVMRLRKEYRSAPEESGSSGTSDPAQDSAVEAFVENPVEAVFTACEALRGLRDGAGSGRHGMGHRHRLALASILRLIPGGREAIHAIISSRCAEDYDPGRTEHHIDSLSCPPMVCSSERISAWL